LVLKYNNILFTFKRVPYVRTVPTLEHVFNALCQSLLCAITTFLLQKLFLIVSLE